MACALPKFPQRAGHVTQASMRVVSSEKYRSARDKSGEPRRVKQGRKTSLGCVTQLLPHRNLGLLPLGGSLWNLVSVPSSAQWAAFIHRFPAHHLLVKSCPGASSSSACPERLSCCSKCPHLWWQRSPGQKARLHVTLRQVAVRLYLIVAMFRTRGEDGTSGIPH